MRAQFRFIIHVGTLFFFTTYYFDRFIFLGGRYVANCSYLETIKQFVNKPKITWPFNEPNGYSCYYQFKNFKKYLPYLKLASFT